MECGVMCRLKCIKRVGGIFKVYRTAYKTVME